jgi:general secretion pathway protein A
MAAIAVLAVATFTDFRIPGKTASLVSGDNASQPVVEAEIQTAFVPPVINEPVEESIDAEVIASLDKDWLEDHQQVVWQGLAEIWSQPGAEFTIQAACEGDSSLGYACLQDQGNWSKINRLGLPVVLVLQEETPSYLLLQGIDGNRLLVGAPQQLTTVSRESVETSWLGTYLVAWPQAAGWPPLIGRGDDGPAVATVMEMAALVDLPYHGDQEFDAAFELWLKSFQTRNGLEADGIVGRNTLLHLMTASIKEPRLLRTWE